MRVPRMSAGNRSGVSWTRWNLAEIACASVVAVSVLATPGTPSSSRWPHPVLARPRETAKGMAANSAVSMRRISVCWPTMTLPISCSRPLTISAAACAFNVCCSITVSEEEPQSADRQRRHRERPRVEIAILRRGAPADEPPFALLDLLERAGQVAAGARADVASTRGGREIAQRPLLEPGPDDAPAFVAQRQLPAVGLQLRYRHFLVGADADAVDVVPFLAVDGELLAHLGA